jgi:glycogen phosphorylase
LTAESLKQALVDNLFYVQAKFPAIATKSDFYMALAHTVRDRQLRRWISCPTGDSRAETGSPGA